MDQGCSEGSKGELDYTTFQSLQRKHFVPPGEGGGEQQDRAERIVSRESIDLGRTIISSSDHHFLVNL